MKKSILLLCWMFFCCAVAFAQTTVRGKVTDANKEAIPGVSIMVKGSSVGASTDANGAFSISAPANGTLVFKSIGFQTMEVPVRNRTEINVSLLPADQALEEVVVTALGIKRSEKSLGYSVQKLDGNDLSVTKDNNAIGALAGQVAGAQVTGSSGANLGGTQKIRLRGVNSVTGGGAPLIIVDGTPFNNGNFSNSGGSGVDYGNMAQDINPDDIESVSVLKGPTASALYGSRGQYGVIIYTTKKGKAGKTRVEFSTANSIERVANFLPQQNVYGAGGTQTHYTFPAGTSVSGQKYINDYDESWGPIMDGTPVRMFYSFYPQDPRFGQTTPFLPQPDNIKNFFETGFNTNNGINISGGNDNATIRVSYNNTYIKGTYPNTNLKRNNFGVTTSVKIVENLTVGANLNYANNDAIRPTQGYQGSFTGASQWFQRNIDINELKDYKYADGTIKNWNVSPETKGVNAGKIINNKPSDWNNPYFDAYENLNKDNRDRYFGDVNLSYQVLPELKLSGFVRTDMYTQRLTSRTAIGGRNLDGYFEGKYQNSENNYEFLAQYNKVWNDVSFNLNAGANLLTQEYSYLSQSTVGGLSSPGWYNIDASKDRPAVTNYLRKKQVRSMYAMASFGYKDIYFLDASIRNDISSALPKDNNSYWYPSVSGSMVFSELVKWDVLSFGKIRASYAIAGSDLAAYQISPIFVAGSVYSDGNTTISSMTLPGSIRNPTIEPSFANSFEIGADLKFFNNRLGIEATYYNQTNKNQIINLTVTPATGYSSTVINAGEIQNKGFEISLNATPVDGNFKWKTAVNWAKNKSFINDLHPEVKQLTLGSESYSGQTAYLYAREQNVFGNLIAPGYEKDDNGNLYLEKVVQGGKDYFFPVAKQNIDFGSVIPNFTGGFRNTFSYGNFDLSALIDFQSGGKFFSWTQMLSHKAGVHENTAAINENGKNVRDPLADGGGVLVSGIVKATGQPVSNYVDAKTYFRTYIGTRIYDEWIYNASYVKMRELSLGYRFDAKALAKTPFSSIKISAIARNPFMIWQKAPKGVDPSELSAGSGSISWVEKGELQTVRTFGLNLNIIF